MIFIVEKLLKERNMEQKSLFVITISRQLGSGGAYIGQQLAKNLDIFYADREIISEASKKLRVVEKELETREEKALFWRSLFESYVENTENYLPTQIVAPIDRELYEAETEIIQHIANERSAVIIGRCGHYILRRHPNHVSIFLHAGIDFRKSRVQAFFNVSEEEAMKMIVLNDKERGRYNHKYTGKDWTDVNQYNLSVDTSKIGVDKTVAVIMKYLELKGIK
jgi:Cytidylate kinase